MRIVLDSQTLLDAVFSTDRYAVELATQIVHGRLTACVTVPITDEYSLAFIKLLEKKSVPVAACVQGMRRFHRVIGCADMIQIPSRGNNRYVPDDPDDDKFVACAIHGGADLIVSRDSHLEAVSGVYRNSRGRRIDVRSAYQCLSRMRRAQRG